MPLESGFGPHFARWSVKKNPSTAIDRRWETLAHMFAFPNLIQGFFVFAVFKKRVEDFENPGNLGGNRGKRRMLEQVVTILARSEYEELRKKKVSTRQIPSDRRS